MLPGQSEASLLGSETLLMSHGGHLKRRKTDYADPASALLPDLVAFMLGVSAASGQALFQWNAAFGDGDAVSRDFHRVLSVAVSGLCQQQKLCFNGQRKC